MGEKRSASGACHFMGYVRTLDAGKKLQGVDRAKFW